MLCFSSLKQAILYLSFVLKVQLLLHNHAYNMTEACWLQSSNTKQVDMTVVDE